MVNISGIAAIGAAVLRPGLIVPHLLLPDIRALSWERAKRLGFDYIVFDKDNCLTAPHSDALEPTLHESYKHCLQVFGEKSVLIVSNSAGSSDDVGAVGAQHLSRTLFGTTVLCHATKKPAKACARQIVDYFSQLHDPSSSMSATNSLRPIFSTHSTAASEGETVKQLVQKRMGNILVVGDRITTDTVTAHRMGRILSQKYPSDAPPRAVSVITTTLWAGEGLMNMLMRKGETGIMRRLLERGIQPGGPWRQTQGPAETWETLLHPQPSSPSDIVASAPPSPLISDPTPSTYLASQLQRSSLPPWASNLLTIMVSNRLTRATSQTFRNVWLLILRGCREGLNRPSLIFDDRRCRSSSQGRSIVPTPSAASPLFFSRYQRPYRGFSTLIPSKVLDPPSSTLSSCQYRPYSSGPNTKAKTGIIKDERIEAWRVQLVDSEGKLADGPQSPQKILSTMDRTQYYLLQMTTGRDIPIVKMVSKKESFAKLKAKRNASGGSGVSAASQPPAEVVLSWLVTQHDLDHKLEAGKRHLQKKGPGARVKVTISSKKGKLWTSGNAEEKMEVIRKIEEWFLTPTDGGTIVGKKQKGKKEDDDDDDYGKSVDDNGSGKKQDKVKEKDEIEEPDDQQVQKDDMAASASASASTSSTSTATAPGIKIKRRGEILWQEPHKMAAVIVFEAYK